MKAGFVGERRRDQAQPAHSSPLQRRGTGLIVAVTLVRPEKKLSKVTVENILSKWNQKSFAAGVKREQIEMCEEKLGIKLPDFIAIALDAMQGISSELGL